jgi:nucleoid-associated protein YgaU
MGILDRVLGKKRSDAKDKPDFSDVRSRSSSTAPSAIPPSPASDSKPVGKTYTVVQGDSLSEIAQREYGDAQKWRIIYEANRDVIQDPEIIHPGQRLRLPSA